MDMLIRSLILLVAAAAMPGAWASVEVDSVNFPAWVLRDTQLQPLSPGERLRAGDQVNTGVGGRAWLAFDDGSVVKLGSETRFLIERAEMRKAESDSLLDAAFDVLRGAFRYTSGFFLPRIRAGHRVDVRVGSITAGIRGTDIWGRSGETEDFVALLEGSIEVSADGAAPQTMDQPLTLFAKKRGEAAGPIQPVAADVVAGLAPETELDEAAGIASLGGDHALVLMSLQSPDLVEPNRARFIEAGYPVTAQVVEIDGQAYTRLLLAGLRDRAAAENLRPRLAERFALENVWIIRLR